MQFSALLLFALLLFSFGVQGQDVPRVARQLPAVRTVAVPKIDGVPDEALWKAAQPATNLVEWRPTAGKPEDNTNRTEIYLLYDNTSVYIGGYCYEKSKDSVSTELVGRDVVGVNDFVGVIFDTYNDKINGFGFYVTPLGEQFDAKYSNTAGEDGSWNGVWDSESKLMEGGWSFEMRIPYSALRFSSAANQTWGLNITRRRNKSGQQYMWSPVDQKINNFMSQEGAWVGIDKIKAPVRLSLSPYFSAYANHYPANAAGSKNVTASVNGGMDVKYGISDAFTLDMTLVPDFGQVQSDNQVLNLSPFEVKYNENRPFFTEGTELFSKGNLFYSRRIGGQPLHYYDVEGRLGSGERIVKNPQEAKLLNATKISGRTKGGLGIGFFNAITKPMRATIEDDAKHSRTVETSPLTNYNIMVLDQTLKNNSSVSFINTNVLRSGNDYDANVSAVILDINNKKNRFNWYGKFAASHLTNIAGKSSTGYSHNVSFNKTGGNWLFTLQQEVADAKYDINDMGILFNNNYMDHYFWTAYRWLKPKSFYNRIQVNYNATLSRRFQPGDHQIFYTNVNANIQFKNLWWAGVFVGRNANGNDFYEARTAGRFYRTPPSWRYNVWVESNNAKKYYVSAGTFMAFPEMFSGKLVEANLEQRYRFNDKFSLTHTVMGGPSKNEAGFYKLNGDEIIFSRRNRLTWENILRAKYNFNNKSGITFRARHYWSKVEPQQLYQLQADGHLKERAANGTTIQYQNINFFNIDAIYTLQFAPGSFINVVWKNAIYSSNDAVNFKYFRNLGRTIDAPQNNNLSIKVLYYLDYLDLKKGRSRKQNNL
ncbi:DUF5916 domain-containing protein [Pseudocnuella soli]|uniref:DUF5916 domain-containing protein n=1 Tax=Pseudocnuella soli TaxID=2502779 RepID=UPI001042B114|nr:DUF5916 domain-containing protein [Pseudocnuella soli]